MILPSTIYCIYVICDLYEALELLDQDDFISRDFELETAVKVAIRDMFLNRIIFRKNKATLTPEEIEKTNSLRRLWCYSEFG